MSSGIRIQSTRYKWLFLFSFFQSFSMSELLAEQDFVQVCKEGLVERLRELLETGENGNQTDRAGYTGLHWAAFNGHHNCVSTLLHTDYIRNIDINSKDSRGGTPLMKAAVKGNSLIVKMLVEHGALVDDKDHNGVSALHFACERGFSECVDIIAKANANLSLKTNQFGWTPLHIAALRGEELCCRTIITHGAELNVLDTKLSTPLMLTCSKGHDHIARLLIQRGAQLNPRDVNNLNALHYAARYGYAPVLDALLKEALRHPGSISTEDVGNEEAHGYTALHFVAEANREADDGELPEDIQANYAECCRILVEKYGAGVQPLANNLVTPLHIAADVGNTQVLKYLLDHGADPNATNIQGDTPLHFAGSRKRQTIIALLVTHGASLNQESYDGITPLLYCPLKELIQIVFNTVFEGNLEKTDQRGYSILHHLCKWGEGEWLERLLEGINKNTKLNLLFKKSAIPSPFVTCVTAGNDSMAAAMIKTYYKRKSRAAIEYMVNEEYNERNILHVMTDLKCYQTLGAVFDLLVHEADANTYTLLPDLLNINELGQRPVLPGVSDRGEKYQIATPTLYQKLDTIHNHSIIFHPIVSVLTERKVDIYSKFNLASFLLFVAYLGIIYLLQFTLSYTPSQPLGNSHNINLLNFLLVAMLLLDIVFSTAHIVSVVYRQFHRFRIYFSNWDNTLRNKTNQTTKREVTWFTTVRYSKKFGWILKLKKKFELPLKVERPVWLLKQIFSRLVTPAIFIDWFGIVTLVAYLISYWIGGSAQWILASLSFIFNTLRLFRYVALSATLGPYASVLYTALTRDFPRFLIIFSILLITFTGGFGFALVPVTNMSCVGYEERAFCNASQTFLSGIRVLLQGHVFEDANFMSYIGFYPSLIYIIFILLVVVFLVNFLVAQFCATYLYRLPGHQRYMLKIAVQFETSSLTYLLLGRVIQVMTALLKAKLTREYWQKITDIYPPREHKPDNKGEEILSMPIQKQNLKEQSEGGSMGASQLSF